MSTTEIPITRMPIATISDPAWADANDSRLDRRLPGRICVVPRPRPLLVAAEITLLAAAAIYSARVGSGEALLLIALCGVFFYLGAVDESIVERKAGRFLIEVVLCVSLAIGACAIFTRWMPGSLSTEGLAGWWAIAILAPVVMRPVLRHFLDRNQLAEKILIIGAGELAAKLSRTATELNHSSKTSNGPRPVNASGSPVMVNLARLKETMKRDQVSRVVIAEQNVEHRRELAKALLDARLEGIQVDEAVQFYERVSGKILIERLNLEWFVYANGTHRAQVGLFFKRFFDISFSMLLIVATAPAMAIVALAIKLDSRGPVFFRQLRVGLNGKQFSIVKFRSM